MQSPRKTDIQGSNSLRIIVVPYLNVNLPPGFDQHFLTSTNRVLHALRTRFAANCVRILRLFIVSPHKGGPILLQGRANAIPLRCSCVWHLRDKRQCGQCLLWLRYIILFVSLKSLFVPKALVLNVELCYTENGDRRGSSVQDGGVALFVENKKPIIQKHLPTSSMAQKLHWIVCGWADAQHKKNPMASSSPSRCPTTFSQIPEISVGCILGCHWSITTRFVWPLISCQRFRPVPRAIRKYGELFCAVVDSNFGICSSRQSSQLPAPTTSKESFRPACQVLQPLHALSVYRWWAVVARPLSTLLRTT